MKVYALLMSIIMVLSVLSNHNMKILNAEENIYTVTEALALDNIKELNVNSGWVEITKNELKIKHLDWKLDESIGMNVTTNDYVINDITMYKIVVPANTQIGFELVYELSGENTGDFCTLAFYDGDECLSNYYVAAFDYENRSDAPSKRYTILHNDSDEDKVYGVGFLGNSDNAKVNITSDVSYFDYAKVISVGEKITNENAQVYSLPKNIYDDDWNEVCVYYSALYGNAYKITVPEDECYVLKAKYKGEVSEDGVSKEFNITIRDYYQGNSDILKYSGRWMFLNDYDSLSGSITMSGSTYYIFLNDDDWSDVEISLEKPQNISILKDSAVEIAGKGEYIAPKTEDHYTMTSDSYGSEMGSLFKIELEPKEGYGIKGNNIYFMTYSESKLGDFCINDYCYGETVVYNATDDNAIYYVWASNYNNSSSTTNIEVDDFKWVSEYKANPLVLNDEPIPVTENEIVGVFLSPWYKELEDSSIALDKYEIDVLPCTLFSVDVPANETYYMNLEYAGEDLLGKVEEEPYGINAACYLVDEDNKQISNIWLEGSGYENNMVDLAINNYGANESKKVYVLVCLIQEGTQGLQVSVSSSDEKIYVANITLDKTELQLSEGEKSTLSATVYPDDATNKDVIWVSDNEKIATVDEDGNVTAISAGTTTIYAIAADRGVITAKCKVTVTSESEPKNVLASEILISRDLVFLNIGDVQALSATVFPENATNKNVTWSSSDSKIATVNAKGEVTAIAPGKVSITATAVDGSGVKESITVTVEKPVEITPNVDVSYHTHIQSLGDTQGTKKNGEMAGTSGMAKRLENIWIKVEGNDNLGIQYSTHCQSYGWMPWSCDGESNGTSGEAKRLEAIKIQLTGADKDKYDVYYRVHAQSYGWLGWAKNGEPSGTAGYGKRLEGIQIVVVKKGEAAPGIKFAGVDGTSKFNAQPYVAKTNETITIPGNANEPIVSYKTHVQSYGWQKWVTNGKMSGTSGEAKRLEGINIKLSNAPYDGDIVYTTHVQTYGWKDGKPSDSKSTWKGKNGSMSGTSGEAKRLEAICIDLTGEMAEHYDIYYRVHAQTFGWLGWAKNGEESGTAGHAKRLEGIQIVLVPKGGAAPADNYGGITSKDSRPFIEKK